MLFGTSMTVVGSTLPGILAAFAWDYLAAGLVLASGSVAYFLFSYLAGRLVDRLGAKRAVAIGLLADGLALALFAAGPSVPANAALWALVGAGQAFIEVGVNWAVLRMETGSGGRAMAVMHAAFAVGAVAGPLAAGSLLAANVPWSWAFRAIAGLFGLTALAVLAMSGRGLEPTKTALSAADRAGLARQPVYWLGFVTLLLYVGVELGITNWSAEFFVRAFDSPAPAAAFMVSAFWLGLLAGRFGIPLLYRGQRRDAVLVALAALLALATLLLALAGFGGSGFFPLAALGIVLAGLGCSCIYPFVVTLVAGALVEHQGEAIGFASTGGGVGAFLFPYFMSTIAAAAGIKVGFAAYAVVAVATLLSCLALVRAERRLLRARAGRG
ncbi:MAG: hypothetical protein A2087_10030 [Spirochaetes bacterium GWD1_61_31]|nr:MAG: hypothetical protein A2Y37_01850 [Spirochaetes bacterium GWB1_60_80]OHD35557.1 MAG: hypothetical protein A2004_06760 [Spirochaetes bacterium GWC1_61_12]OHD40642.1 MAG: hypothetical protein A2087_10030 [Spirochaetes bacterium GWD1_61_31]OHD43914.1 MAG: hypothetical protein A2Y35_12380 [Spirochaetes bacterium GWE1_60_18]OHD59785.1 MAG: hypothetical protein A2Y32_02235 [Spirochaetes bacterium GWF1_60_12]